MSISSWRCGRQDLRPRGKGWETDENHESGRAAAGKRQQTMTMCPCKDCPFRDPQCHGKCEMYREWRKELTAVRQKERLEKPESMEWQLYHKGK